MEERFYGFYRARVVDNVDTQDYGRVLLFIPDIMHSVVETDTGLWAWPANNPLGGRNTTEDEGQNYMGSSYIPKIGSWLWVFFEQGNPNRPYYWMSLNLENAKVLPENQVGTSKSDKWVIFKSHDGRTIVVSDDDDDARVEITGKKRLITKGTDIDGNATDPSGDTDSVYTIDDNQTSILLDEREGAEKLLIRTHKGDYLNIDITNQTLQMEFANGIFIKTDGDFHLTVGGDIVETSDNAYRTSTSEIHNNAQNILSKATSEIHRNSSTIKDEASGTASIKSGANLTLESGANLDLKAGAGLSAEAAMALGLKAGMVLALQGGTNVDVTAAAVYQLLAGSIITDGATRTDQSGSAAPTPPTPPGSADSADSAEEASPDAPIGNRD